MAGGDGGQHGGRLGAGLVRLGLGLGVIDHAGTGLVCNVYYWETLEALQQLVRHPAHLAAKQRQAQWLQGYQVVIAQVLDCHGDGRIRHPLAQRAAQP